MGAFLQGLCGAADRVEGEKPGGRGIDFQRKIKLGLGRHPGPFLIRTL